MTSTEERKKEHIQDYHKMLLFLNESTEDYFFLWDMEENSFYLSKELTVVSGKQQNGTYIYPFENMMDVICPCDREKVKTVLKYITESDEKRFDLDFRYLDEEKRKCWVNCKGNLIHGEGQKPFLFIGCISRRVLSEKIDLLTGLMNYDKMLDNLGRGISRGRCGHLMVLGIDEFGDLNQRMGRDYGNHILKCIGDTLEQVLEEAGGEKCNVYRMDGDHFGVDLVGYSKKETIAFFHNLQLKTDALCSFSCGVVCYPYENEADSHVLVSYAENALTRAKKSGKNRMMFFSSDDYNENISRMVLQQEIKESIKNGFKGFELFYQPQVTSNEYCLHGAEALLRYHSEKFGFMSPAVFIPVLEQTGMMIPVGKWVLQQALVQCAEWIKKYGTFNMSINISYVQMKENGFAEEVLEAVKKSGVPGESVTLEVTESMQLQDYNYYNAIFYHWRKKGIHISIDDFGTGYSSLGYLKSLEVDEVKIDRCFVRQIHKSMYNYRLLSNMMELTKNAQIRVCCEGVEEEEELRCLDTLFPALIQGFLFGRPIPAEEFEKMFLQTDEIYQQKIRRLREEHEKAGKESKEEMSGNIDAGHLNYKMILDHVDTFVYATDMDDGEILYMNSEMKKLTGVYNYHGCKCYQIFMKRTQRCPSCTKETGQDFSYLLGKMFYEEFGRKVLIREKGLKWNDRNIRLVVAFPVDGEDGLLDQKLNQDLYTAEGIIRLYEQVIRGERSPGQIDKILRFAGKYYQADRVCLFLYDKNREFWQDVAAYHAEGVMDKKRHLEVTTVDKMKPWMDYMKQNPVFYIESRETLKEIDEALYQGYLQQDIRNCMLCGVYQNGDLVGLLSVDNPDQTSDKMALLRKAAFLVEQMLFYKIDEQGRKKKLHKMVEKKLDHSILSVSGMGLWQMKIDRRTGQTSVLADENMRKNLGVSEEASPEECYEIWRDGIENSYLNYVKNGLETVKISQETVELEYLWNHAQRGLITVRCVGTKTAESDSVIVIDGYCRILEDLKQIRLHR